MLRYSLLRIMLLFGCMLVLWLVGVRDPVWLLLGTAVSSVALSYVVLRGPREELARQLAARVDERTARRRSDADIEDAEVDRELERDADHHLHRDLDPELDPELDRDPDRRSDRPDGDEPPPVR
jgi:hypothetical protein